MKSILQKSKKPQGIPYPKLMISENDMVVLFLYGGAGTVVYKGNGATTFGSWSNNFNMELFKDYNGNVILTNDNPQT